MVGPALATIVRDLGSTSFIWVGSASALVATAFIPLNGGFSHVCYVVPIQVLDSPFRGYKDVWSQADTSSGNFRTRSRQFSMCTREEHEYSYCRARYIVALSCSIILLTKILAIQGLGGGSMASLTYIVVSDMVPLREREVFNSLISMYVISDRMSGVSIDVRLSAWTVGLASGPVLGDALTESGRWRWPFCKCMISPRSAMSEPQ